LSSPRALPREVVEGSPYLVPQFTPRGGHVAFVDGGTPWQPRRWAEAQALRFFAWQLEGGQQSA
jgi:predicted alpha/beta-fold hydrolase